MKRKLVFFVALGLFAGTSSVWSMDKLLKHRMPVKNEWSVLSNAPRDRILVTTDFGKDKVQKYLPEFVKTCGEYIRDCRDITQKKTVIQLKLLLQVTGKVIDQTGEINDEDLKLFLGNLIDYQKFYGPNPHIYSRELEEKTTQKHGGQNCSSMKTFVDLFYDYHAKVDDEGVESAASFLSKGLKDRFCKICKKCEKVITGLSDEFSETAHEQCELEKEISVFTKVLKVKLQMSKKLEKMENFYKKLLNKKGSPKKSGGLFGFLKK